MKITNITNKTVKPVAVSIMVNIKGKDLRFDLRPGESVYSNGNFNTLFNKSLRVQKQKGLIDVIDEYGDEPFEKIEELTDTIIKTEEEKVSVPNAFDNPDLLFYLEPQQHPDILIIKTNQEVDYSSNIIPEEDVSNNNKKIIEDKQEIISSLPQEKNKKKKKD